MSEPPKMMLALPCAAVWGVVVRSPVSDLTGRPLIFPFTVRARCTLLTFLVLSVDSLIKDEESGSGPPDCLDDEQPLIRAAAIERAARTARIGRRVCMTCSVAGRADRTANRKVARTSRGKAELTSLRRCSP